MNQKPSRVYQLFIRTTPERLWQALTDGEITPQYYFGGRAESTWEVGAPYRFVNAEGNADIEGEVLEVDPPRKLVTTFKATWSQQVTETTPSTLTWEITPAGDACKLVLIHGGIDPEVFAANGMDQGWTQIISGLKTYLETGQPLVVTPNE